MGRDYSWSFVPFEVFGSIRTAGPVLRWDGAARHQGRGTVTGEVVTLDMEDRFTLVDALEQAVLTI